jgi:hypothetical protein
MSTLERYQTGFVRGIRDPKITTRPRLIDAASSADRIFVEDEAKS